MHHRRAQQQLPTMRLLPLLAHSPVQFYLTACQVQSIPRRQSTLPQLPGQHCWRTLNLAVRESTASWQQPRSQLVLGVDLRMLCQPSAGNQRTASRHQLQT